MSSRVIRTRFRAQYWVIGEEREHIFFYLCFFFFPLLFFFSIVSEHIFQMHSYLLHLALVSLAGARRVS